MIFQLKFKYKSVSIILFVLFFNLYPSLINSSTAQEKVVPDTVKIGTYIISIHDINFRDKEYTSRFWMWMLYDNPEFDFTNQVEVTNAKSMEKPEMMVDTIDGRTWVLMKMKCVMKESWEIDDYPFDAQKLSFNVENTMFDAKKLVFSADTAGSIYDPNLTVDGWNITSFKVKTGISPYHTAFGDPSVKKQFSEYANFKVEITMERSAWGLFLKIFSGMYIAFLIAIVSFIIHPRNVDPRFGLPVGGLFAAVGNKYIIDSILPENSSFTLVDTLHSITFLFIFFTIAVSAISLILINKNKLKAAVLFNRYGSIVVVSLYFLLNITLIIMALIN